MLKTLIFTDLDGSLLDRDTFKFDEIKDYIKKLLSCIIPQILSYFPNLQEIRVLKEGDGAISATYECHMNYSTDSDTAKVLLVMIGIDDISLTKSCQ